MWEARAFLKSGEVVDFQIDNDKDKLVVEKMFENKYDKTQLLTVSSNEGIKLQLDLTDVSCLSYNKLKSNKSKEDKV